MMVAVPERWPAFPPPPPRPTILGEAQVLEIGECDAAHQRVPVQSGPGAALEMAQPQLSLELLVRLLTHPARLAGGSQCADRDAGREVAEVVFTLARCAPLADQPRLSAR